MFNIKNITQAIFILLLCLGLGVTISKIYQPESKNIKIYKLALKDYDNENYSNSYFLFSKIGAVSPLKPAALYRQAMCAKKLGDKSSELKMYQQLIRYYPRHKFSTEAGYYAGQLLIDEDPGLAYKYFDNVSKSDMDEDYKVASEYFKARITSTKLRYSNKKVEQKKIIQVEKPFREYLKQYPDGRLATGAAKAWLKFNPDLTSLDYQLIARAYYYAKMKSEANQAASHSKPEDIWAVNALLNYQDKKYDVGNAILQKWIGKENKTIYKKDYNLVIDNYSEQYASNSDKYTKLSELLTASKGDKKDYIWNLKCRYSPNAEKFSCYQGLYKTFPKSDYAKNALFQSFMLTLEAKEYSKTKQLALEYLVKYADTKEAPMVMYWVAKINSDRKMLDELVKKYPDSYYAYRAFWILHELNGATIKVSLKDKPVVYPYKLPNRKGLLYHLLTVSDYDLIKKYTGDEFIDSWVEYQKGNYAASLTIARDAMAKLNLKPSKHDVRWRLVYPQNYFKQVKRYSYLYNNNEALMMAILREESSFNSQIQSDAGAMGLMQLMPVTAKDIATKNKVPFDSPFCLLNPETNIKLGNLYYSELKKSLNNNETLSIAAYNGGIGSVTNWKNKLSYSDIDEFVVQIPYEETRYYIEKIFGSYWNYSRIYQN